MGEHNTTSKASSEPLLSSPTPVPQADEASGAIGRVVLIADDEEPIAEAIGMIVEEVGALPLLARNGQHALELARTRWPALLITDWMMPILDGLSLIQALRQQAALDGLPPVPTILLTAARLPRPVAAEADAFLTKPFELDELEALLRRLLAPPTP